MTEFAIEIGLPEFSSSWEKKNCKSPEEESGVWCEMFEAVVGFIFLDQDRDFGELSKWLCDRFIRHWVRPYWGLGKKETLCNGNGFHQSSRHYD